MVTMNSGKAMEIIECGVKAGMTNSTGGTSDCDQLAIAPSGSSTPKTMTPTKASSAAGTA
ncbi:hypothetical protein D3C87_2209390 [compost metagenome]